MTKSLVSKIVSVIAILALAFGLSACGQDGKPDAATVKAGVAKAIESQFGTGAESEKMIATFNCIIDEAYDDLSLSTLLEFAQGKDPKNIQVSEEESAVLERVTKECIAKLVSGSETTETTDS